MSRPTRRTRYGVGLAAVGVVLAAGVAALVGLTGTDVQPAVNDRLELATDLTFVEFPTTDRIDGSEATVGAEDPIANSPKATLWWTWTARTSAPIRLSTEASDVPTHIRAYEYDEGGFPELTEVANAGGPAFSGAEAFFASSAGTTFAVQIDQPSGSGVVQLSVEYLSSSVGNDDFDDATEITQLPFTETSGNAQASTEVSEPDHGGEPAAHSLWWTWTAATAEVVTVDTCGSSFDTTLHVHSGDSVDDLFAVAGNDDDDTLACDTEPWGLSQVTFNALPGQTFHFAVDGFVGAAGPLELNVSSVPAPPESLVVLDEPCVIYASKTATGTGLDGPFDGLEVRTVQVDGNLSGQGGAATCIPADASSAVLRISSIDPLTEGNLRMTPAGVVATGGAGVVNYGAANGLNNANTVIIPLSVAGAVDIEANAGQLGSVPTTDVRLSVIGYYTPDMPADLRYFPLNPCVLADSRDNKGASDDFDGPNDDGLWPVGSAFPDIDVKGTFDGGQGGHGIGTVTADCGVPLGAEAVMLNVVAVNMQGGSGFLSVGREGIDPIAEPATPFAVLSPKMNNGATTIVRLGDFDEIAIDIDGDAGASTMIRVEVLGYFDNDPTGLDYSPIPPCAFFDTRTNNGRLADGVFANKRKHGPTHTTTYQVTGDAITVDQGGIVPSVADPLIGTCGVPLGASAVLVNFEAVNALQEGNFWVAAATPAVGAATTGGVLNWNAVVPKMNNANAVVVPLSASGEIDLEVNAGMFTADGTEITEARGIVLGYFN